MVGLLPARKQHWKKPHRLNQLKQNARSIATGIHHLTDEAAPSDDSDWSSNGSSYCPHSSPLPLLFSEPGPSSPSLSPLPSRWLHRRLLTTMEIDRHWKISLCWTAPKDNPKCTPNCLRRFLKHATDKNHPSGCCCIETGETIDLHGFAMPTPRV